jgi:hypothetical protein
MKKNVMASVSAVVMAVLAGIYSANVSAQQPSQTWSVAVHISYPDGFEYDGVVATGIPASELHTYLAACGQSHRWGSAVRFHCYSVPE